MTQMSWCAVRCCCDGKKIYGFLQFTKQSAEYDQNVALKDHFGNKHFAKLLRFGARTKLCQSQIEAPHYGIVAPITDSQQTEIAVFSDDRPIEFWRTIEGFVEAVNQPEAGEPR